MVSSSTELRGLSRIGGAAADGFTVPKPRSRWRARLLVPLAVLVGTAATLGYASRDTLFPPPGVYVVAVVPTDGGPLPYAGEDAVVDGGSGSDDGVPARMSAVVQAPGWIEPAPYAVSVPALAEGVVSEVMVLEGERVEAGQVVVRLIDADARLGLAGAEAAVSQRRADIVRAQASRGTAEARVRVMESAVLELADSIESNQELVKKGAFSAGEFRRMKIRLSGLEAEVNAGQRGIDEASAEIAQAEAALAWAEATVAESALRLSRMEIRAPSAGVVLARLVEPGSRMSMSATGDGAGMSGTVLRLYDPMSLQVRVDVPLADAAKVGVGTRAEITTEAMPDTTFAGVVTRVIHEANIQRNTVQFKVAITEPSPTLKPEMLARVRLRGGPSDGGESRGATDAAAVVNSGGLLVPERALAERKEASAVLWAVVADDNATIVRRIEIEFRASGEEGFVTVSSGLNAGDRLVNMSAGGPAVGGLRHGMRVRVLGERKGDGQ